MNGDRLKPAAPNSVTMLALMCGVSSLHMTLWGRWEAAVVCILLASLFDFLDGKVARCLKVSSRFGAELDSLSDFVCFGVAPGFLMYNWSMPSALRPEALTGQLAATEATGMPWACALVLAVCCGARLARFNAMLDEEPLPCWTHFFTGVPAPAGGFLAMAPLVFCLGFGASAEPLCRSPWFVSAFVLGSGILMASRLPTVCLKHLHLSGAVRALLAASLLAAGACCFVWPWTVASVMVVVYLLSLPVSGLVFLRLKARDAAQTA